MAYHYRDTTIKPEDQSDAYITALRSFLLATGPGPSWTENDWSAKGAGGTKWQGTIIIGNNAFDVGDYVTITDLLGDAYSFVPSTSTATPADRTSFEVGGSVNATAANLQAAISAHRALGIHFDTTVLADTITMESRLAGVHWNSMAFAETDGATDNFTIDDAAQAGVDGTAHPSIMFVRSSGTVEAHLVMASSGAWEELGFATQSEFEGELGEFIICAVGPDAEADNGWNVEAPFWSSMFQMFKGRHDAGMLGIRTYGNIRMCANVDRLVLLMNSFENGSMQQSTFRSILYAGNVTAADSSDVAQCTVLRNIDPTYITPSTLVELQNMVQASGGDINEHIQRTWGFPRVVQKAGPLWDDFFAVPIIGRDNYMAHIQGFADFGVTRVPAVGTKLPYSLHSSPPELSKMDLTILINEAASQEMFTLIGLGLGTPGLPFEHEATISAVVWEYWPSAPLQDSNQDMLLVEIGTAV